jgi:hypothetical protein
VAVERWGGRRGGRKNELVVVERVEL